MRKFLDDSFFSELLKSYGTPVRVAADQAMVLALVEMEGPNAFSYERNKKGAMLTPNNPSAFGIANIRDVYVFMDRSKKKTRHIVVVEGVSMDGQETCYFLIGGKAAAAENPCVAFLCFEAEDGVVLSVVTVEKGKEKPIYTKSYRYTEKTWAAMLDYLEIIQCLLRLKFAEQKDKKEAIDRLGQFLLVGGTEGEE